ncbi:MAG: ParB N-terminal domain-containing protein [Phycisphaerales bacterium]|jgi:ParB family chromosome partitioning protein|nr:ParB N-terminal domain-containing protein [Phycisphaerales bacterium]
MTAGEREIVMIPIDRITVVNPRSRGREKFKQIVGNISNLGLKKPITVAERPTNNGSPRYDLVCGQGRLEAYKLLGETEVPAFVVEATKDELLLMSLAENLARRSYRSNELMREIAALKDRGHNYAEIAKITDLQLSYVKGIIRLVNKGEDRLIRAVEKNQIPLSIAVTIASSDHEEVQEALREAYEKSTLRGKELLRARKLIEQRRVRGVRSTGGRTSTMTADGLMKRYQEEVSKQRREINKAKVTETRLLFVRSALKRLLQDASFVQVLRDEALDEMPQVLVDQPEVGERG